MRTKIRLYLFIFVLIFFRFPIYAQETKYFNNYDIRTVDHWVVKISTIKWDSATIKNALEVPYVTFVSDIIKGKLNLLFYNIPTQIQGRGIELSTPKCLENSCSDFYISLYTSGSNYIPGGKSSTESASSTFSMGTTVITINSLNSSDSIFSSVKQDLKNVLIGYQKDYYWFQENPYLRNIGMRIGVGLDVYNYKLNSQGYQSLNSLYVVTSTDTSLNTTLLIQQSLYLQNSLNYTEALLQIKLGINYAYEFIENHILFLGVEFLYGYGEVSYKLQESQINLSILELLNTMNNPFLLMSALPQSELTDGPALLESVGHKAYLSYAYKIDAKQIVRVSYSLKEKQHKLNLPKIEPDETINFTAILTGDLTPFILSEIKPTGLLPKNKDTIREIGVEYMFHF